jgi:hypothetical protein
MELAYVGMIVCRLVSQDISEDDKTVRACEFKCQDGRKNEIVMTGKEFRCPQTLYVDKMKDK